MWEVASWCLLSKKGFCKLLLWFWLVQLTEHYPNHKSNTPKKPSWSRPRAKGNCNCAFQDQSSRSSEFEWLIRRIYWVKENLNISGFKKNVRPVWLFSLYLWGRAGLLYIRQFFLFINPSGKENKKAFGKPLPVNCLNLLRPVACPKKFGRFLLGFGLNSDPTPPCWCRNCQRLIQFRSTWTTGSQSKSRQCVELSL